MVLVKDFKTLKATDNTGKATDLDMPETSNVLQFFTADGTKVSVRPSATEHKIKFYMEINGEMHSPKRYAGAVADAKEKGLFIIIVLHHHIISIPNTGRERNILSDAGDILLTILENNVNLVLSGHKHVPHAWKMNNTLFATAGTVSSMKLRGNTCPSYNVIDINNQYIEIMLHNSNGTIKPLRHP